MDFLTEIKTVCLREKTSIPKVSKVTGRTYPNIFRGLQDGSIKLKYVHEMLDSLGYEIVFKKKES